MLNGARFSQALIHLCTLVGTGTLQPPVCWSTDQSTTSATVSSFPTSQGLFPRAEFMERNTAAFSLLLPSFNWKIAVSIQLSIRVEVTALCFWPNRENKKRAMFPSPSMGHILWTLNFIWVFGTERKTHHVMSIRTAPRKEYLHSMGKGFTNRNWWQREVYFQENPIFSLFPKGVVFKKV